MQVLAALSGGVDSAVAAARAVDAGHDVTAVHLALSQQPATFRTGSRGCCSLEDSRDARRVADVLGLPYYVWDLSERFTADVVDDFVAEYAAGRTPHPCMRCNESIKFAAVLDRAMALGFDAVCTGHYARLLPGPDGTPELHRAVDPDKDQSYVLGVLDRSQLAHSMFPLGDSVKAQVRAEAEQRGLGVSAKPESHDICFIPDGDTSGFLASRLGTEPGEMVDASTGDVIGSHPGVHAFTVGQRRGLALGRPAADGRPRYVVGIDATTRTVLVGGDELLGIDLVQGEHPRWAGPVPVDEVEVLAQWRSHGEVVPATLRRPRGAGPSDSGAVVHFARRVRGVSPGQSVVLYQGTRVVGSVTVSSTQRLTPAPVPAASG